MRALGADSGYDAEDVHCTGAASPWFRPVETDQFTCAVRRRGGRLRLVRRRRRPRAEQGPGPAGGTRCRLHARLLINPDADPPESRCTVRPQPWLQSERASPDRPEAALVRPQARRTLRRRRRRGRPRLAGGPARRRGRPARLRVPAQPPRAAARVAERLEAGLARRARGALPGGRRLRNQDQRSRDPLVRHRPQRPAQVEPLGAALRPRRPRATRRGLPRRRLPPRAGRTDSIARSSTATRRARRSPPPRSSRR